MIKAVIFDLDGVIVTTDDLHYKAWKYIADNEGIYFDENINNKLRGISRKDSLEILLKNANRHYSEKEKLLLSEKKNNIYVSMLDTLSKKNILPNIVELLTLLKKNKYLLAIGSSSKNARIILEKIDLLNMFDAISDGNNISKSKPDPEVFIKAANMLGIPEKYCAVIEDAESGLIAAKSANMITFGAGDAAFSKYADYNFSKIKKVLKLD